MYDPLTFLTDVYAECQAFCAALPPAPPRPGRKPTLSLAQVLALSLLCQWAAFGSERGFHRWAGRHLHGAFCPLPAYSQFNRAARAALPHLACLLVYTARHARAGAAYEILDSYDVATRRLGRRGEGWLRLEPHTHLPSSNTFTPGVESTRNTGAAPAAERPR